MNRVRIATVLLGLATPLIVLLTDSIPEPAFGALGLREGECFHEDALEPGVHTATTPEEALDLNPIRYRGRRHDSSSMTKEPDEKGGRAVFHGRYEGRVKVAVTVFRLPNGAWFQSNIQRVMSPEECKVSRS